MWEPKHLEAAEKKAREVARFYMAYWNFRGDRPTTIAIGNHFNRSDGWASVYLRMARKMGLIGLKHHG